MKTLTFQKAHNLSQLHDELLAAVPVLRPVPLPADQLPPGVSSAFSPVMKVEGSGDQIILSVPDETDEPAITQVINAHTPRVPVVPLDIRVAWQNYKSAVNNATNVAQIKSALTDELGVLIKEILKSRDGGLV